MLRNMSEPNQPIDPYLLEFYKANYSFTSKRAKKKMENGTCCGHRTCHLDRFNLISNAKTIPVRPFTLYKVLVTTADVSNAGTSANVYITLKGDWGSSVRQKLKKFREKPSRRKPVRLESGSTHSFYVVSPDLGNIKSVVIEHDSTRKEDGWLLECIQVLHPLTRRRYMFLCNHWLSLYKEDGLLVRELFGVRSAKTMTGDCEAAGTDCNVFIKLFGRTGITPRIQLVYNQSTRESRSVYYSPFARGMSSKFIVNAPSVGAMTHVRISHDGRGELPHWFLERLVVTDLSYPKWTYYFHGSVWLSPTYADRKLFRMIRGTREPTGSGVETEYQLTFYTGDLPEAATTADVFVQFHGESGISREMWLNDTPWQRSTTIQPHNHIRFARGNCVQVRLPPCQQYGPLKELSVGHNRRGSNPKWYLEKVIVDDLRLNRVYEFPCHDWIDEPNQKQLVCTRSQTREPSKEEKWRKLPIEIYVHTGNESTFSVSTQVFIRLYGPEESSEMDSTKSSKRVRTVSGGSRTTKSVQSESTEANAHTSVTEDRTYATRRIWLSDGVYERNRVTRFRIDLPVPFCISPFTRVEVGHDGSGKQPPWFLDRLVLYCPVTGFKQTFLCNHWLAKEKEDGKTVRTLLEDKNQRVRGESRVPWTIRVKTSKTTGAGTTSIVKLILYGLKQKTDVVNLDSAHLDDQSDWVPERAKISTTLFTPGTEVAFRADLQDIGIPYKLRIGHDNSGTNPAWHLERVTLYNWNTDQEYLFLCNRWLGGKHDDQAIVRELPAQGPGILKPASICHYKLAITTGDKDRAETSARVFINLFGECGDTGERWLVDSIAGNKLFRRCQTDEFLLEAVDLKNIKRIRIGHDSQQAGGGWYLHKVVVKQMEDPKKVFTFVCDRWLDVKKDDGLTVRDLVENTAIESILYEIVVKTGNIQEAGTSANVFLCMYGKNGDTGPIRLKGSTTGAHEFKSGASDVFQIPAEDVGELTKIRLWHDDNGRSPGWFLDQVSVVAPHLGRRYVFRTHRWLDRNQGDGKTQVDLEPTQIEQVDKAVCHEVTVFTGVCTGAGTNGSVSLQIFGSPLNRTTNVIHIASDGKHFQTASVDIFKIFTENVGIIQKINIGHDCTRMGWYLDRVRIRRPVDTGEVSPSRTNLVKDTQKKPSEFSPKKDAQNSLDSIRSSVLEKSGSYNQMCCLRDEDGMENYWFIAKDWLAKDKGYCQMFRDLIATTEDGQILTRLTESTYEILVQTGTQENAGTTSRVYLTMYGSQAQSGDLLLNNLHTGSKLFSSGAKTVFTLKLCGLGELNKVKVYHDSSGEMPTWFLDHLLITETRANQTKQYLFPCYQWLGKDVADGSASRVLMTASPELRQRWKAGENIRADSRLINSDRSTPFIVRVCTGTDPGAGTDSNVYLELFGEQTSSGLIPLKTSLNQSGHSVVNKFEAGCLDTFTVKAMDIGPLKKIRLAHDSTGVGPSWQVARVEIDAPKLNLGWTFPCNRWLKSRTDRKMSELDLYPQPDLTRFLRSTMSFEVTVFTSEESSPLMTAAVFLQIYGQDGQSSLPIRLQFAEDSTTLFKRNSVDTFYVEVLELHMPVSKIRIWHDNNGVSPHWHVRRIELRHVRADRQVIETYVFLCEKWLSRGKVDGAIERELVASKRLEANAAGQNEEISLANRPSVLNYEIRVITGNRPHAGTDANVYLTLFGENGDSGERKLAKSQTNANKFESGQTDVFLWEAVDLGQLHKARIRHDNSGVGPSWFLSRIEVQPLGERKMDTESGTADKPSSAPPSTVAIQWKPTVFYCERWLSTHHEDSLIDRTLLAQDYQPRLDDSQSLTSIQTTADLNPLMKHALLPKGVVIFPRKVVDLASGQQTSEGSHIESTSENERLPTTPYHLRVVTGSVKHAGTTGPVWIRCVGRNRRDSGKMMLFHERRGTHLVKGSAQSFYFDAPIVDEIIEVEVCNESVGDKAVGWFLRSLDIDLLTEGKQYHLECNTWLSSKRADGKTQRCFPVTTGGARVHPKLISYHVVINTADEENAGLDSDVYLKLFGSEGTTHENLLEKCGHRFERGTMDKFRVEFEDVGSIEKLRLRYDAEGERRQWKLRDVVISRPGKSYQCGMPASGWYSIKNDGLKCNWADLVASVNGVEQLRRVDLRIRVKTSNISGAATDSGVYLRLFGQHGDSGDLGLKTSFEKHTSFRQNAVDEFLISSIPELGTLSRCRLWHDAKGRSTSWHCEWVEVQEVLLEATARCARQWRFNCSKWLSTKEGDQLLVRDLPCTEESINDPARGRLTDPVVINTTLAMAEVAKAVNLPDRHYGDIAYDVYIKTGDMKDAGTPHQLYLTLEGKEGLSRKGQTSSLEGVSLQTGSTNHLKLLSPPLGKLTKVRLCIIGKSGTGQTSSGKIDRSYHWYCERIVVVDPITQQEYQFQAKKWIESVTSRATWNETVVDVTSIVENKNLQIVKEWKEKATKRYKVSVYTGNKLGGGTDANVYIQLFGETAGLDSGLQPLKKEGRNLFERNQIDEFQIESYDLGILRRIVILQDNSGASASWFLDKILVTDLARNVVYNFPCEQWLSKSKGDKRTWKEIYALP